MKRTKQHRQPAGTDIEELSERVEHWRQTRTKLGPMPEPLWQAAVAAARKRGVGWTARQLNLAHESLKRRVEKAEGEGGWGGRAAFVDIGLALGGGATRSSGVLVELSGKDGQKLTVRLDEAAQLDVCGLVRELWRGQR